MYENKLRISAVTLFTKNMSRTTEFYSSIPGFEIVYESSETQFVTFSINDQFINLEFNEKEISDFGRIIFHVENVDKLYEHLKQSKFSDRIEGEPKDASGGGGFSISEIQIIIRLHLQSPFEKRMND